MQDKVLNHIAVNASLVFQNTVRLFPPGFPKTEEEPFIDFDSLRELEEDLFERIEQTQRRIEQLEHGEVLIGNQVTYATEKDIYELRESLELLLATIKLFNNEFELNIKPKLARGDAINTRSKLGEVVEAAAQQRTQFNDVTYKIQLKFIGQ